MLSSTLIATTAPAPRRRALRQLGAVLFVGLMASACGGGSGSGSAAAPAVKTSSHDTTTADAMSAAASAAASGPATGASASEALTVAAVAGEPVAAPAPQISARKLLSTPTTTSNSTSTGTPSSLLATSPSVKALGVTVGTSPPAAAESAPLTGAAPRSTALVQKAVTGIGGLSPSTASLSTNQVDSLLGTSGFLLPIRVATENWTAARTLVASDSGWSTWVSQKRTGLDKWFGKSRDRFDLIAGLPNDYVDPVTGAALQWTVDSPEPPNGTTAKEIAFKGAWVAIMRQTNVNYALDAARLFQLTGDTKLAELAAAQLDFYADSYNKWPLRTAIGNSRMFGQTLEEATTVLQMLEVTRALAPYVATARRAKWRDSLFFPIATNLQAYSWGSLNNMNMWCAVATAAIGMEFSNTSWTDAGLTGPRSVAAVMNQGVTPDGIWYEGAFAYNNYVLQALARLFDLAAAAGRGDVVAKYGTDVQRMLFAPVLFRFDDGTLPSPNDTRTSVGPIDKSVHTALYRHVPSSYGVQNAATTRSWARLMDPPPTTSAAPALPAITSVFAPDTGFASLRVGAWQLFVHFGQKTQAHAQAEALGYELAHGNVNITRDAGTTTSYSAPQHTEYFSQGLGNNVPLVDGLGPDGYSLGEVKAYDGAAGSLDVLQASYRSDTSAQRTYKLDGNGFTETTRISLTKVGATPRRLGVMFNTACSIQVNDARAGSAIASPAPAGPAGFKHWTNVTKQTAQANWSATLTCGIRSYALSVSGPSGHLVYRATAPNTPLPATRNALYLETTSTSATFTTSIRPL